MKTASAISFLILFFSCHSRYETNMVNFSSLSIESKHVFAHDTINSLVDYIVVENFIDSKNHYNQIDSFLLKKQKKNKDRDWYKAFFLKKSNKTTISKLEKDISIVEEYSLLYDQIYVFSWNKDLDSKRIQKYYVGKNSRIERLEKLNCLK